MANDLTTFNFTEYLQKLVKLIPAEVIVLYSTIMALLPSNLTSQLFIIGVCAVVTPLYLIFTLNVKNWLQVVLSSISFLVYAFASGGAIETISGYQTWMPGVALALFTMITPMFVKSTDASTITTSATSTAIPLIKSWRQI